MLGTVQTVLTEKKSQKTRKRNRKENMQNRKQISSRQIEFSFLVPTRQIKKLKMIFIQ